MLLKLSDDRSRRTEWLLEAVLSVGPANLTELYEQAGRLGLRDANMTMREFLKVFDLQAIPRRLTADGKLMVENNRLVKLSTIADLPVELVELVGAVLGVRQAGGQVRSVVMTDETIEVEAVVQAVRPADHVDIKLSVDGTVTGRLSSDRTDEAALPKPTQEDVEWVKRMAESESIEPVVLQPDIGPAGILGLPDVPIGREDKTVKVEGEKAAKVKRRRR